MMSSDERREVASAMRLISGEGVRDLTLGEVLNSILTGGAPRPTTETAILARLADLIDPTCHVVVVEDESGDRTEVHDCCGDKHTRDAFTGRVLPYCPGCGARVVTGDGE